MLPDLYLCAPVLPTHIGIDSTLMYSMHLSVDSIAGAYWEARLVFPQQVRMFVVRLRWNICILENGITSGVRKGAASNLVVKEGGGARPASRGEWLLLMDICLNTKGWGAGRCTDTVFPAFPCCRGSLCSDIIRQRWSWWWLPWTRGVQRCNWNSNSLVRFALEILLYWGILPADWQGYGVCICDSSCGSWRCVHRGGLCLSCCLPPATGCALGRPLHFWWSGLSISESFKKLCVL